MLKTKQKQTKKGGRAVGEREYITTGYKNVPVKYPADLKLIRTAGSLAGKGQFPAFGKYWPSSTYDTLV